MAFPRVLPRSALNLTTVISAVLAVLVLLPFSSIYASESDNGQSLNWIGPEGSVLPFKTYAEIEDFLRSAQITSVEKIKVGINETKKVILQKDGIQMTAAFRDVEIFKQRFEDRNGLRFNFRDSCIYECAAYELSKMLGLPHVPPVVRRTLELEDFVNSKDFKKFEDQEGTMQAWVEDAFTEKDRVDKKQRPPDFGAWAQQHHLMALFDNLIFNDDRNLGNILIGPDWKIWFIDSTRSFRTFAELKDPEKIKRCDRSIWENLQKLTDEQLDATLSELLREPELRTLKERRLLLISHIEGLIEQYGESSILFSIY
ncbi:MAG: hypothetical protein JSU96_07350 [Acidobacteriota bacterium]|nr:MAG: hypothetical protein JSU96_07350 [Acidobacteriota bacterium]